MKRNIAKFIIFLLVCKLFFCTTVSIAKSNPPVEEVEIFEPFYAEILNDGKWYLGILLSEKEYKEYTQLKIDYNSLFERNVILTEHQLKLDMLFSENKRNNLNVISELKDIRNDLRDKSFWDSYKFEFGIGIGVVMTILTIVIYNETK